MGRMQPPQNVAVDNPDREVRLHRKRRPGAVNGGACQGPMAIPVINYLLSHVPSSAHQLARAHARITGAVSRTPRCRLHLLLVPPAGVIEMNGELSRRLWRSPCQRSSARLCTEYGVRTLVSHPTHPPQRDALSNQGLLRSGSVAINSKPPWHGISYRGLHFLAPPKRPEACTIAP